MPASSAGDPASGPSTSHPLPLHVAKPTRTLDLLMKSLADVASLQTTPVNDPSTSNPVPLHAGDPESSLPLPLQTSPGQPQRAQLRTTQLHMSPN